MRRLAQHKKHDPSLEKPFKLKAVTLEWENWDLKQIKNGNLSGNYVLTLFK